MAFQPNEKNPMEEINPCGPQTRIGAANLYGLPTSGMETNGNRSPTETEFKFKRVPLRRHILMFGMIILANCIIMGLLVGVLSSYDRKPELETKDKRTFNTSAIFLSTVLSLGIGILIDSLALVARGFILLKRPHTLREIAYVVRGTLSSQFKFIGEKVHRRHFDMSAALVIGFIVVGMIGRLGIAFLGLTFNVQETPKHDPSREMTPWPYIRDDWSASSTMDAPANYSVSELSRIADAALVTNQKYFPNVTLRDYSIKSLKNYTGADLNQTVDTSNNFVSYLYEVVNFEDNHRPVGSGRTALVRAQCRKLTPLVQNTTGFYYQENGKTEVFAFGSGSGVKSPFNLDEVPSWNVEIVRFIIPYRTNPFPLCGGHGCAEIWAWKLPDNDTDETDVGILFRCTNTIVRPENVSLASPDPRYSLNFPDRLLDLLPRTLTSHPTNDDEDTGVDDYYEDYYSLLTFDNSSNNYMLGAMQRSPDAGLWVAAAIARHTAILIRQLNREIMPKLQIHPQNDRVISKLEIKWVRVWILLGSFLVFQVLVPSVVLFSSKGSIMIEDDVSTLGNLFSPFRDVGQPDKVPSKFVLKSVPVETDVGNAPRVYSLTVERLSAGSGQGENSSCRDMDMGMPLTGLAVKD